MTRLKFSSFIFCTSLLFLAQNSCASANNLISRSLFELGVSITVPLAIIFMGDPAWYAIKNKKHKAPDFVQKQAQDLLDTLTKKGLIPRFGSWWKKKLGYITVYEGANEEFFSKNPNSVAVAKGLKGIHFPAESFKNGTMSPNQIATLCHEIVHIYYWDTISSIYQEGYKWGNETWYQTEYRAEYTTIEILYQLGMHEAVEIMVKQRLYDYSCGRNAICPLHPYIFGTIDSFYTIYKDCPEKIKDEAVKTSLETFIKEGLVVKTYKERYEVFAQTLKEKQKATATA